jgi:hypothetical protein
MPWMASWPFAGHPRDDGRSCLAARSRRATRTLRALRRRLRQGILTWSETTSQPQSRSCIVRYEPAFVGTRIREVEAPSIVGMLGSFCWLGPQFLDRASAYRNAHTATRPIDISPNVDCPRTLGSRGYSRRPTIGSTRDTAERAMGLLLSLCLRSAGVNRQRRPEWGP